MSRISGKKNPDYPAISGKAYPISGIRQGKIDSLSTTLVRRATKTTRINLLIKNIYKSHRCNNICKYIKKKYVVVLWEDKHIIDSARGAGVKRYN